jgi:hypothetical protein
VRHRRAAIAWARAQISSPVKDFTGLCLQFVRMAFGLASLYGSAIVAWDNAERKHPTTDAKTIPRGVPVFWRIGKFGHVALSLGGGLCLSTDVRRRGRVDIVRIDHIREAWGAQLLGWTEDLNGVTVWQNKPKAPAAPAAAGHARNNVRRARAQLRVARRCVAIAERYLQAAPEERQIVHSVAESLDRLEDAIHDRLGRLPKS